MKNMTTLEMVKITASIKAKVAFGPVPNIIGNGPKINTTPAETEVSSKRADIIMKSPPTR